MLKLNYFKEFQTLAEFLAQLYSKEAEIFRYKARQKDTDARRTKKRSELHYGYKAHAYADEKSKFIIYLHTTPANVYDSLVLEDVLSDEDTGMELLAYSAYSGQNHLVIVESFGMTPVVCEKGTVAYQWLTMLAYNLCRQVHLQV